jgi:hypothetical protein
MGISNNAAIAKKDLLGVELTPRNALDSLLLPADTLSRGKYWRKAGPIELAHGCFVNGAHLVQPLYHLVQSRVGFAFVGLDHGNNPSSIAPEWQIAPTAYN